MSEYYAVVRSDDALMHYGIKGMKWGIRRAIKSGNSQRLAKQYSKAARKLGKLSLRANRDLMKKRYTTAKMAMAQGAAVSAGMSAGLTAAANKNGSFKKRAALAGIAGLAGGVAGAAINSKGISSGRYVSDRGHAKAVAKRDKWKKNMEFAFAGTKYASKSSTGSKKRRKSVNRG